MQVFDWYLERVRREEKNTVCNRSIILTLELPSLLIHHFFHSIHTSGVQQMHLILGGRLRESPTHTLDCEKGSILYRLDNGSQVDPDPCAVADRIDNMGR